MALYGHKGRLRLVSSDDSAHVLIRIILSLYSKLSSADRGGFSTEMLAEEQQTPRLVMRSKVTTPRGWG